jgi:hypothetical protein
MNLSIDNFKANFRAPARHTLFRVQLNFPTGENSNIDKFFCKGSQLPSSDMNPIELSYMGRKTKYAGDRTFHDWMITVYNDTNFTIRDKIERWVELAGGAKTNLGEQYWDKYQTNMNVFQLDMNNDVIKEYKLVNCWPMSCGDPIDLSWDMNDTAEEYSVTFSIDYWESNTTN